MTNSLIGVCVVTYNEEKFIAECIDSVLAQECTTPIRVYVANDCSTDGTAEVCRSYGERIIFLDREENLGIVSNTMLLLDQIRMDGCDYIVMLDGDDYWCDNHKLQKEIDYLREHPEYGLVHTCVDLLYPKGIVKDKRSSYPEGDVFEIMETYAIRNCSVMFKTDLLQLIDFEKIRTYGLKSIDYVMYYIFSSKTKFAFLPDHTAIWRRTHESVSNSNEIEKQLSYIQNSLAHWKYLSSVFPEKIHYTDNLGNGFFHERAFHTAFRLGDSTRAIFEFHQMQDERKHILHNRLKFMVAHVPFLFCVWRSFKNINLSCE